MAKSLGSLVLLLQADTKRLEKDLGKANSKLRKFEGGAAASAKKITSSLKSIGLGLGIGASVGAAFSRINTDLRNFGSAISDLSAITGATGEDLEFLTETAREFGATTTLSATEAATALKLIGSAKPDLLASGQALAAVTKQAIILSEASGVSLAVAANTLGGALNQMSQEADQAGRFINVLAAGSVKGASEIGDTSLALKNAGVAASLAGLSFEEMNASIQLLSLRMIKGGEAGTALQSIFLRLLTVGPKEFNPALEGMEQALKNMAAASLTTKEKLKLFGQEGLKAAEILISSADEFGELTEALTGTSTALDQQRTRTNNLENDYKKLASATENLSLEIGESLNASMRESTQLSTEVISGVAGMIDEFNKMSAEAGIASKAIGKMLELDLVDWGTRSGRAIALLADTIRSIAGISGIAASSVNALIKKSSELSLRFLNRIKIISDSNFASLIGKQTDDAGKSFDDLGAKIQSLISGPTFQGAFERRLNAGPAPVIVPPESGTDAERQAELQRKRDALRASLAGAGGSGGSGGSGAAKANASAGIIQSLRDELALSKAITDEQKFQVELTQGRFRDLVGGDAALGRQLAIQIQAADAAAEARQIELDLDADRKALAADTISDLERQIATYNLITDAAKVRFELEEGAYKSLDGLSKSRIADLAAELEELEQATIKANKLKDDAAKAAQTAREFGNVFTSAFEDAIVSGGKLSDILKGIEQDLIRLIIRKSITVPLQNAIGGLFDGGDLFGGLFGGARAGGGPVNPNQAFLVGEQGRELFVPPGAGNIVPNDQLSSGGGAMTVNLIVNGVTDADSFNRSRNNILAGIHGNLALARARGG